MATIIRSGGAWRTATKGRIFFGGVWRVLKQIKIYSGGQWRTVANFVPALSVSVNPATASGAVSGEFVANITTANVTATPFGGSGPFSYQWTLITPGEGESASAQSPQFAVTKFYKPNVPPNLTYQDTFRVTVTDNNGQTATAQIVASFIHAGENGDVSNE